MRILVLLSCWCLVLASSVQSQSPDRSPDTDTMVVELDVTIEVLGERVTPNGSPFPFEKERFNQVLTQNGFGLITKGVFLAQDIQADGFKRDDITIVIDGERYHSACPNRMDSPLARSNSLEMDAIELNKTSSSCCSGIGGSVAYRRRPVGDYDQIRTGISQSAGASESSDIGFAATTQHHRLAGRYAFGSDYSDGDGRTFVDRYGYSDDVTYRLAEASLTGRRQGITYRGDFTYTEDVMFPYLRMDERRNRVFSGSVAYRGHKLYANHTEHLMDNELRTSPMRMVNDAMNTTVGITGPGYEAFYRHWTVDNETTMPTGTLTNKMMPGVNQFAMSAFHEIKHRRLRFWGRAGVSRFSIDEEQRAAFYASLYDDQSTSQTFLTWAAGAAVQKAILPDVTGVVAVDAVAEPPTAQSLYIALQRPMGKPWWSGNPGLRNPIRTSLRGNVESHGLRFETSASYVWNYVDLASQTAQERIYMTYENFDAIILAANLRGDWRYLDFAAGYTWAEREASSTPLTEIPPFALTYTLTSPHIGDGHVYWRHTYNDAQTRVDPSLRETATTSWHRFDAGINYDLNPVRLSLEVENLFDELYTQHMSYLRDPFASGVRVYEPGRTVRVNLTFDSIQM